jgi:heme-degrading monooxygenase HmoA
MYAQVTYLRVPINKSAELRDLIETRYLPAVRLRPGFLAGYLLQQADDPDTAQLVLFWDSQKSVENFTRTGLLEASVYALASDIPGVEIRREGYIVPVAVRGGLQMAEAGA